MPPNETLQETIRKANEAGQKASQYTGVAFTPLNIGKAEPPDNVTGINNTSSVTLPDLKPSTPDTSGVSGYVAYLNKQGEYYISEAAKAEKAKADQLKAQQEQTKGLLGSLTNRKTASEKRDEASRDITGKDYSKLMETYQEEIAPLSEEVTTLQGQYDEIEAEKNALIERLYNNEAGMTRTGMSGEEARIERDYASKLNNLATKIKSKSAVLATKEGNFNQARTFINEAVDDATADEKFDLQLFTTFYDMNQDIIDKLDEKYSTAIKSALATAGDAYKTRYDEAIRVGELIMDNPNAGISLTDSFEEAARKVASSGGSLEARKEARQGVSGDIGFTDVMQAVIDAGGTPEQAAREAAIASENSGIPVSQETLNGWVRQARNMTKTPVSQSATTSTTQPRQSIYSGFRNVIGSAFFPDQLRREQELKARGIGTKTPQQTYQSEVNSFFSNLFGG